ncbi:MAG: hypothetical protein KDG51_16885, partial [Calditrichaeota bacterium]|nr:hypothetical protein [Calditrichota bacterium]
NDNIIEVTVPDGATDGTITVTTGGGSDTSDEIFEVSLPPFDLNITTTGSGSVDLNPAGGSYNTVTTVTLTAIPDPGYTFVGWSGDLSGTLNPETLYMDRDYAVTANFIPQSSGVGPIFHQETRNGASSALTTVTTDVALTAVSNDVYLAAITTRPLVEADAVSGMGLSWTRLASQCSGRGNTGVEIWLAQGIPAGDEAVTATFPTAPSNA